jgi:acyl-coenzyme A thioesterase PaaI-like protein
MSLLASSNPMGTLHGGILCDLTDAAMGMAFASTLALDESFTTTDLNAVTQRRAHS